MTTRLDSSAVSPSVHSLPTAHRTTAVPARPFQAVMNAGAGAVIAGAEGAVRRLPGGPILAAAFRPVASNPPAAPARLDATPSLTPEGLPASGEAATDPRLEGALASHADQNLYFIALQERISAENRTYSAYSNILRVRHETMKNAIGNFR